MFGTLGIDRVMALHDALQAPNLEGWTNGRRIRDRAVIRESDRAFYSAFPDYQRTFPTIVVEPPFAAVHWTITGTQQGMYMERPATGTPWTTTGMTLFELEGGLLRRYWLFRV